MDEQLEIKKLDRQLVEVMIAQELDKLVKETAFKALNSFSGEKFTCPDTRVYARKLMALVSEHLI